MIIFLHDFFYIKLKSSFLGIIFTIFVFIFSFYLALPSFIRSTNNYFITKPVNLGLDLKGGVSLLLRPDFEIAFKTMVTDLNIKDLIIKDVFYNDETLSFTIAVNNSDFKISKEKILKIFSIPSLKTNHISINNTDKNNTIYTVKFSHTFCEDIKRNIILRTIEIIENRINSSGGKEIEIYRYGSDSVLLQIPGVYDIESVKRLIGSTGTLSFHLIDNKTLAEMQKVDNINYIKRPGIKFLPLKVENKTQDENEIYLPIKTNASIQGDLVSDAGVITNMGEYMVSLKFKNEGAKKFAEITSRNIGNMLAIVMDNKIISAPRINDKISNGSCVISGTFNLTTATELATILRSGSLPASINILEEKTIDATLGKISIENGIKSIIIAFLSVIFIMIVCYGIWGIFANIALLINIFVILGIMSIIDATLTLHGIAGIVLTLGMAVDSNILIIERIIEKKQLEYANKAIPKGNILSIIKNGYAGTMPTILDANTTTAIVAIVLYIFGSGSVKGFALTLIIGIFSSIFTSVILTKFIVIFIYRFFNLKNLYLNV